MRLIIFIQLMIVSLFSQTTQTFISFNELQNILERKSPSIKMLDSEKELILADRDENMKWSNPQLSYSNEIIENDHYEDAESILAINKEITMPWVYLQKQKYWKSKLNSTNYFQAQEKNDLLIKIQSDYIWIKTSMELVESQKSLKDILMNLNSTLEARLEEGAISKVEYSLLFMSLFNLESEIQNTRLEFESAIGNFSRLLGLDRSKNIVLSSNVDFKEVELKASEEDETFKNHPGLLAKKSQMTEQERKIALAKQSIFSSVYLEGGFKKVNPDFNGYTLGISIPLPVFNINKAAIRKEKVKYRLEKIGKDIYEQKLNDRTTILIGHINRIQSTLKLTVDQVSNNDFPDDILTSYQEGYISLSEFLNAIQLFSDAKQKYQMQLADYYASIFEYESLTGQKLVTF